METKLIITIPACPNCNSPAYTITPAELIEADGFSNCEYCGYPVAPDPATLNAAAIDTAMDEQRNLGKVSHKPGAFLSYVARRRSELVAYWNGMHAATLAEWKTQHGA